MHGGRKEHLVMCVALRTVSVLTKFLSIPNKVVHAVRKSRSIKEQNSTEEEEWKINQTLNPFLRSTRPNWTRFGILRASLTLLNPKIGPKIGLNPQKTGQLLLY